MTLGEYILQLKQMLEALDAKVTELESRLARLEPKPKTKAESAHA